jgi:hypothetical protein
MTAPTSSHPLSDAHLRAIGLVITEWARTERALFVALVQTARLQPGTEIDASAVVPAILTGGMTFRTTSGLLKSLINFYYPTVEEELSRILKKLGKESEKRDVIAHADWWYGRRPESIKTVTFTTVGKYKREEHDYTVPELEALACRIAKLRNELIRILGRRDRADQFSARA